VFHSVASDLLGVMFEAFSECVGQQLRLCARVQFAMLTPAALACAKSCSLRKCNLKKY